MWTLCPPKKAFPDRKNWFSLSSPSSPFLCRLVSTVFKLLNNILFYANFDPNFNFVWRKRNSFPTNLLYIMIIHMHSIPSFIIPIKYSWANYTNSLVNHGICNKNRFHYRKMFPLAGWYFLPPNPISSSTEAEVHSNAISYVASRAVSGCRCHGGSAWKLEITPQS